MEGGSDEVRQAGSGSGGREGREGWLIMERARTGRNEAWTERGKERREEASGRRAREERVQPSEGEEQGRDEGRREQGRQGNFKGCTLRGTLQTGLWQCRSVWYQRVIAAQTRNGPASSCESSFGLTTA